MFAPFARKGGETAPSAEPSAESKPSGGSDDIDTLKRQMEEMQRRLDRLGDKDK